MLTSNEKNFLIENGYLNLGILLNDEEVETVNSRLEELKRIEGKNAAIELVESKYIRHPKKKGSTV